MGRFYTIIIPVFNRPEELDELLESLTQQHYTHFEVVVVEDGSILDAKQVVAKYLPQLDIQYLEKENGGQGFARNFGMAQARGDYFVILDSDATVPAHYLQSIEDELNTQHLDLFGGPDTDHPSFSPVQKAISYSMTSLFTTGGIRGKKKNWGGTFHPRSFNMGLSREVWEKTKGFIITRKGEDIEFSIRAIGLGFRSGLIEEAFIYHKRRTSFSQFYKQLHFFGRSRVNITRFFPETLQLVHFFPLAFTLFVCSVPLQWLLWPALGALSSVFLLGYGLFIGIDCGLQHGSLLIGLLGIRAAFTQLLAYGFGFMAEWREGGMPLSC
jgi:glycosyltransferase involved in cell wall biosynthesis